MARRRSRNGGGGAGFLGGSGTDLFNGVLLGTVANLIAGVVMGGAIGAFIEEKVPAIGGLLPGGGEPVPPEEAIPPAEAAYARWR